LLAPWQPVYIDFELPLLRISVCQPLRLLSRSVTVHRGTGFFFPCQPLWRPGLLSISRPTRRGLHCSSHQSAYPSRPVLYYLIRQPVHQGLILAPMPAAWSFRSVGQSVEGSWLSPCQPICGGLYFRSVNPFVGTFQPALRLSVEACTVLFYLLARPPTIHSASYTSRPLRGGFAVHSLSVGPSVEALYCAFYQSAPPWRLCTLSIS
jgi:hypothetical protein